MGVVLRDIRPSNIMLTKEGVVKIIIPNLVKILGTPTAENPAGMPRYMSPEQFRTMDVDQRSDIYSFGVVLYEMFTGKQPFPEPKDLGIWAHYEHHHTKTKPSPLRQINPLIPERLELVVIKCLEKRPEDRYQSFEALKKDLIEIHQTFCGGRLKTEEGTEDVTAEAWYNKGMSLRELDKYWEAVECFNRALEINPRHAEAWSEKGNCLANLVAELEDFFEAEYCFDKALEINPGFAKAWNNKGVCLIRQGEMWKWLGWRGHEEAQLGCLQKAIKCFDKATEIDPKYAEAWRNKGSALCWLGLRCCDIALEIDPNDEWTRDLKEKVLEALRRAKRTQSES